MPSIVKSLFAGAVLLATSFAVTSVATAADVTTQLELVKQIYSDPAARAAALGEGKNAANFCANCHGDTGISRYPEVPNLAGQNSSYLIAQMEKFATGARKDDFMQKLIKVLPDRDRAILAVLYSTSKVEPAIATPSAKAKTGEAHFRKLCVECHGEQALGNETIPRLAGQQTKYLRLSIDRYRKGSGERVYPMMTAATMKIPAQDIDAVVEYIASMR